MVGRLGVAYCRVWWKVAVEEKDGEIESRGGEQVYIPDIGAISTEYPEKLWRRTSSSNQKCTTFLQLPKLFSSKQDTQMVS